MNGEAIGFIIDIIILVLLAVTVFYAGRLSFQLKNFRESRTHFERLIGDISDHITRADTAIRSLKDASEIRGASLQRSVDDAQSLIDELHIMLEAGNSLASRLEKGATRDTKLEEKPKKEQPKDSVVPMPMFSIQDRDFDDEDDDSMDDIPSFLKSEDDDWLPPSNLQSRAEKDLFKALKKSSKK